MGWWAHHCNPEDWGPLWLYLPLRFPLPSLHFLEEVDIQHHTQDTEQKSQDCSCKSGYKVFTLPPLWLLLMPQRVTAEEEEAFWHGLDLKAGEELEQGVPPPDIWIKDMGCWVWWGPVLVLEQEGPPLPPLGEEPMEVEDGAEQVQEDDAVV